MEKSFQQGYPGTLSCPVRPKLLVGSMFVHFSKGPSVGGAFAPGDPAPRAVQREYWQKVCPHATVITTEDFNEQLGKDPDALTMMNAWSDRLRGIPERCVEIHAYSNQIFDYMCVVLCESEEQAYVLVVFLDHHAYSPSSLP